MQNLINNTYEHKLQAALCRMQSRGILLRRDKLAELAGELNTEINFEMDEISKLWGVPVFRGGKKKDGAVNIASPKQLQEHLISIGIPLEKKRKSGKTGTDELTLIKAFAVTNDECLKRILRIREIDAVLGKFVEARLVNDIYYCIYNAAGTTSGRRGSRKHTSGVGNNAQNWPKHNDIGKKFRKCFYARRGRIFFSVDQKQAEDWAVSALSASDKALAELRTGQDRHRNLAGFMFKKPIDEISEWPERFLGKKSRHAFNYGMAEFTFSESLAKEGFALVPAEGKKLLESVHNYDPNVRNIYHQYVRNTIERSRTLRCPLGRERIFLGFRPRDANTKLFNEAFSYIPQSTIADNTGLAIVALDAINDYSIHDGHDSITQEVPDSYEELRKTMFDTIKAFDREIVFHNGYSINIPVEGELGYCLGSTIKLKELNEECLKAAYEKLQESKG